MLDQLRARTRTLSCAGGGTLGDGRLYMFDKWWMATFPGLAIFITTLSINLAGDGMRDRLGAYSRTNL